jgi:hypothetical protein
VCCALIAVLFDTRYVTWYAFWFVDDDDDELVLELLVMLGVVLLLDPPPHALRRNSAGRITAAKRRIVARTERRVTREYPMTHPQGQKQSESLRVIIH